MLKERSKEIFNKTFKMVGDKFSTYPEKREYINKLVENTKDRPIKVLVVYHLFDCDGHGVMNICKSIFSNNENIEAEYYYCKTRADEVFDRRNEDGVMETKSVKDIFDEYDLILIGDLSFTKEKCIKVDEYLKKAGEKLFIVDHHGTAEYMNEYNWAYVVPHDLDKENISCGTLLMYWLITTPMEKLFNILGLTNFLDYININYYIPEYVAITSLYDTYMWKRLDDEHDKEIVQLYNTAFGYDKGYFDKQVVDRLLEGLPPLDLTYVDQFKLIVGTIENIAKECSRTCKIFDYHDDIKFAICYVGVPMYYSQVGEMILDEHPEVSFVIMINMNTVGCSLRSRDDFDLSEIVKPLGGGGHPQAAGFPLIGRLPSQPQNLQDSFFTEIDHVFVNLLKTKKPVYSGVITIENSEDLDNKTIGQFLQEILTNGDDKDEI